jgi:hypothetical protein
MMKDMTGAITAILTITGGALLIIAIILFALSSSGCTDEQSSVRTLRNAGYSDIEVGGYEMFACSDSDTFSTKFTATNPRGERVNGVVCCGWLKHGTVRF